MNQLISTLGRFGINYYGHLFDYFVGFLEHCIDTVKPAGHGKRSAPSMDSGQLALHGLILESLTLLFNHDKRGFVDGLRFEKIVKPLCGQLSLVSMTDDFINYSREKISPSICSLTLLMSDDFMWKTVLHHVCSGLRIDSIAARRSIADCCSLLIDKLADRFVVILNDFIPHLSNMLDDEDPGISHTAKAMVKQIGQYSSDDVYALIRQSS